MFSQINYFLQIELSNCVIGPVRKGLPFLQHRRDWTDIITYMQRISPAEYSQVPPMSVQGKYIVKGERGGRISAKEEALRAFEDIGFLYDLNIVSGESVSFRFRDVGSVLELYVY